MKNKKKMPIWCLIILGLIIVISIVSIITYISAMNTRKAEEQKRLKLQEQLLQQQSLTSEKDEEKIDSSGEFGEDNGNKLQGASSAEDSKKQNPIAIMEVEEYGTIKIELYPEIAPNTVKNFITLANRGFYDGLKFHRVVEKFMIQGGDPAGNGSGGPTLRDLGIGSSEEEYCIKGEFSKNGHKNSLAHDVGVISMARADYTAYSPSLTEESYNSGGSQFFIVTEKSEFLDGAYATFGKVIEGMDVVEKIENVDVYAKTKGGEVSTPVKNVVISKVTVETYGKDYGLPETLEPFNFN